ncbi:MAG TPA: glycosyl hydrolase family 18 protein [Herpetosiphonaceae bacterium]|nr:glycosyl hydrolase family 18 protein [Herpetosiphonaceae bacterium]
MKPGRASASTVRLLGVLFLLLGGLAGLFAAPPATQAQTSYKVVGYLPSWAGNVVGAQLDMLTHVNYAFLLPNGDGSYQPIGNPGKLQELVTAAHARNKKVLISVGGWNNGDDRAFEEIAASSAKRATFATNLNNFMLQYGLDGIDIDWEYPEADDAYTELIAAIRAKIGPGKLLTAAVAATSSGGSGVPSAAIDIMDYITLMAYDGNEGSGHSPYSLAQQSLDYWGGKTAVKSKLILGVPFYARPGWFGYNELRAGGCSADSDTCFYGGATQYYNGRPTIRAKVDLMKSKAGGGIMIWELSQDTAPGSSDSLLKTLYDQLGGGVPPANNLALNKPALASSVETAGFEADKAFDGNSGSRWASAYSDPQWLRVDLGSPHAINRVVLRWEAAYGRAYQVQVSPDGNAWSTIYSTTTGDGGVDDLTGLSGSGRYLRVYATARGTQWGYSLWEFEAYGSAQGSCGSANVALGKATRSSSNENASLTPNLAVDGSAGTRWSSAWSDPQWIEIDLAAAQSVCRVRLNWEAAYGRAYQVQVSNDRAAWTTISSTSNSDGGIDDLTGLSGSGRYLRIYGTARATAYGYSLWEAEVYMR